MSQREPSLSMRLLWPFARVVGSDARVIDVLASMGLNALDVTDRERRVTCRVAMRGLSQLVHTFDNPLLGLIAGLHATNDDLDVGEHAARATENLGEALSVMVRYGRISNEGAQTWMDTQDELVSWCYKPLVPHPACANDFVVASALSFAKRHCEIYSAPHEVWVMHERPDHLTSYASLLGTRVRFGAPCNAVAMHASVLQTRMRGRNALLAAAFEHRAREVMQTREVLRSVTQRVREVISPRLLTGTVDMLDVAHALGMSPTTLWRKLEDEGTSFSAITDELRKEVALRQLHVPDPNIADISMMLGFADVRAFNKAFKRWMGVSPAKYRDTRLLSAHK